MFNHFIKTRFNAPFKAKDEKRLDLEWLNYRLDIFKNYCVPSVLSQTNQKFFWFILIDKQTPNGFKEKLNSIDKRIYLYSDDKICFDMIKNLCDLNKKTFISRLDSDDVYRKDFISKIQSIETDVDEYMIDTNYLCFRKSDSKYYEKNNRFSHFLSFCAKDLKKYAHVSTHLQYLSLSNNFWYKRINEPLALEIIHGDNLYNQFDESKIKKMDMDLNNYFSQSNKLI